MPTVSHLDISCQLNDPNIMLQLHDGQKTLRKLDVVIIPNKGSDAKMKLEEPRVWKDPLACIQFKRIVTAEPSSPATTYEVAPYRATKPDLDGYVSETPATAEKVISQLKSAQATPAMELRRSPRSSTKAFSESKRKAEEVGHTASAAVAAKRPKIYDGQSDLSRWGSTWWKCSQPISQPHE